MACLRYRKLPTHPVDLLPTTKMKNAAISANTDSLCSTSRSLYHQTTNRMACLVNGMPPRTLSTESIQIHPSVISTSVGLRTTRWSDLILLKVRTIGTPPDVFGVLDPARDRVCCKDVRTVNVLRPAMFRQPEGFTGLAVERYQTTAAAGGVATRRHTNLYPFRRNWQSIGTESE